MVLGKDGEPINPPITYEIYEPWKVVVKDTLSDKTASKKFFSYKEAKESAAYLRDKYGERAQVAIVSRQLGYGPPHSRVSDEKLRDANDRGLFWCPYCRNFKEFPFLPWKEEQACEFCQTRMSDFHVIRCNPLLWSPPHYKRVFGG